MAYFPPLVVGSETYRFTHLEPTALSVQSDKAKKLLSISVLFSNHCFTKEYDPAEHPRGEPVLVDAGRRKRTFCPVRYRLSQNLPVALRDLPHPKMKIWQTAERRNWVYSLTVTDPDGPYHIFFELRRARGTEHDLKMVIESAYSEDPTRGAPNVRWASFYCVGRFTSASRWPPSARNEKRRRSA